MNLNYAYQKFFEDNKIDPNKMSNRVIQMMLSQNYSTDPKSSKLITSTGGFIRQLSTIQGGGTVLPTEFFGKESNSYHADVSTTNFTDATPQLTRLAIPATFKGGNTGIYKFISVAQMKRFNSKANKNTTAAVNSALQNVYNRALKGGNITAKSLKESFNAPF